MRRRIAITGASGFVGRHVMRALLREDVDILIACRDRASVSEFVGRSKIVQLDVTDFGKQTFDRLGRPDILVHLAWGGLPNYRSLHHFTQEAPLHFSFLKGMVTAGLKSLVVTGTCFEYGMQSGPLAETVICQPSTPYGFAKHALHQQLEFLQANVPFNLVWARLFYMFGEGQAKNSLWTQLKSAVAADEVQFKMSGGEQLRDFLPIGDLAALLVRLALTEQNAGSVNVCSGRPQSVRRLVEEWITQHRWDIELVLGHYPYPDYEPMAFWGSRQKLDAILGL